MPGTIQSIVNQAGDVVAKMSVALESFQTHVAAWNGLATELDKSLIEVQNALAQKDKLLEELATLKAQKAEISAALGGLTNVVNRLAQA